LNHSSLLDSCYGGNYAPSPTVSPT
jgi:hypothetical protein